MKQICQPNSDLFQLDAVCIHYALLCGDLNQAFSILADLMIESGQTLTVEQFAECYQRGLFPSS